MSKINLLIIATGNYTQFLPDLLESADKYFLKNHQVTYNVFTDKVQHVANMFPNMLQDVHSSKTPNLKIHLVEHRKWPWATIQRFKFFRNNLDKMLLTDYYFYIDADCIFKAPITDEILGERVAVSHCGYQEGRGFPYERNQMSTAYVAPNEGTQYFGGGFWGFSFGEFCKAINVIIEALDKDEQNGIVPIWHDESIFNRYLIDNQPTKILSPSYHWPENNPHIWNKWAQQGLNFECKILLLDKNHAEIRG